MRRDLWIGSAALAMALTLMACGGGGDSSPASPTPAPTPTPTPTPGGSTIAITGNAVSPQTLTVAVGTRVTFVNNDTRNHEMASDPHPSHGECPALNDVGALTPGQSRQSGNLNTARTCGFHDHNLPTVAGLQGRIVVQ
jgi:plastocyanin